MTPVGSETILAVFLMFCRIGTCLMLMPGFSSERVPVQPRLFLTLAITLALAPALIADVEAGMTDTSAGAIAWLVASEMLKGGVIGLLGRFFFLALKSMATVIANAIGLGQLLGAQIEDPELAPPIVSFITLCATVLLFATNQHAEVLRGLADSYAALPVQRGFAPQANLVHLTDVASRTFVLTLRVAGPFIAFAIVVNLAIGLTNKLTPQIPVYFISLPFIVAGGLLLFYLVGKQFFQLFISSFATWLATG